MDEPVNEPRSNTGRTGKGFKRLLLILLAVVLLGCIIWLFLMLRESDKKITVLDKQRSQQQKKIDSLQKALTAAEKKQTSDDKVAPACNDTPTATMRANIKAALDTKNTAAFVTYTTDPVKYVLAASEYGGDVSAVEAATSLEYTHAATGPWGFTLPAATIASYEAGFYTDYFDVNTYTGKAASGMVVAFDFNCDGKISQIFVAAHEDLL